MPRTTSVSTASNIPTRPAIPSRSAISSKSTHCLPTRPLCVFENLPLLVNGPYMPDTDFQSNGLSVLRASPKPVGLRLGGIDTSLSQLSNELQVSPVIKHTAMAIDPRPDHLRKGSSFDYEKSMASMKIEDTFVPLDGLTPLVNSSLPIDAVAPSSTPQFNSLYDLDAQYPSSRSLNALSPDAALTYSYSPNSSSPWSFESVFAVAAFTSPADTLSSSSSDLRPSWSSSSRASLLGSPIVVKSESSSGPSLFMRTLMQTPDMDADSAVKSESDSRTSLFMRTPDISVAFADINMFQPSASSHGSNGSINPAYITAPLHCPPLPSINHHVLRYDEDVFKSPGFGPNGFTRSLMLMRSPENPQMGINIHASTPVGSSCMVFQDPSALPGAGSRPRIIKRKSSSQDGSLTIEEERAGSIIPGTPILDAHRGIDQGELEAKARRYQQRNPGAVDFDKHWLASFSGKLSDRGEMIKDFRCYVVGCTQVNKRRDHMVVHVGSHLHQRPFRCEQCPLTFLRKNELKRHEQGHDTARPFACSLCQSTFRRQDLLTRHLKNRHQVDSETDKENSRPRKKQDAVNSGIP
ncbi:hypothetical protein DFH09DRAFT_1356401 [Mycena vulgaris]|nr:hypothetical protein DFH09DRAFT_1356401 [Mycena vulgaris]